MFRAPVQKQEYVVNLVATYLKNRKWKENFKNAKLQQKNTLECKDWVS